MGRVGREKAIPAFIDKLMNWSYAVKPGDYHGLTQTTKWLERRISRAVILPALLPYRSAWVCHYEVIMVKTVRSGVKHTRLHIMV